jgi:transposase InsO family protein
VRVQRGDAFTRECLALETDTSMPSRRVTKVLPRIINQRGAAEFLASDNGPEVSSRHYLACCVERSIGAIHIQPGKPTQNGHVESFQALPRRMPECELVLEPLGCEHRRLAERIQLRSILPPSLCA